jgi:Zn-finger nucleic acid-binding protein
MPAEAIHCPACGAPAAGEATHCQYCGTLLATVACPVCFGRMLVGAKFCSHCGASTVRAEVTDDDKYLCPRCQVGMKAIMIGNCNLRECPHCEGMWTDVDALQQICTEQEKHARASVRTCGSGEEYSIPSLSGVP